MSVSPAQLSSCPGQSWSSSTLSSCREQVSIIPQHCAQECLFENVIILALVMCAVNIFQLQSHAFTQLQIGWSIREQLLQYCGNSLKSNGTAFVWSFSTAACTKSGRLPIMCSKVTAYLMCTHTWCNSYLALQQAVCWCRWLLLSPPAQHGSCLDGGDTSDPSFDLLNLGCGEGVEGGKEGPPTA